MEEREREEIPEPAEESVAQEKKDDITEPKEEISISKEEWEKNRRELEEGKDRYLRLLAETENVRKRLQKEKSDMLVYAKEELIREFLNPIDHFGKALSFKENLSEEMKNWMVGFEMILSQFKEVLHHYEVSAFDSVGKTFDPGRHEAMEVQKTNEYPPDTVLEEYVKGYVMGDRVIRPAKVRVSRTLSDEGLEQTENIH